MRNKLILLLIALFVLSFTAYSQDVPKPLQVKLMLKILSMDRNFDRFGEPIKIGSSSDAFLSEMKKFEGTMKIKQKDFTIEKMSSPDEISKFKVIYVGKEWEANYSTAAQKAGAAKALMFCETESAVLTGGGGISFKVVGGKPKIVLNLSNLEAQGSEFPAGFLKITVVVGSMK